MIERAASFFPDPAEIHFSLGGGGEEVLEAINLLFPSSPLLSSSPPPFGMCLTSAPLFLAPCVRRRRRRRPPAAPLPQSVSQLLPNSLFRVNTSGGTSI